jgi:hypothetical protein
VLARLTQWLLAAVVGQNMQVDSSAVRKYCSGAAPVLLCLDGLGDVIRTLPFSFKAAPVALDAAIGQIHQALENGMDEVGQRLLTRILQLP